VFLELPLCAIVGERVFCVHGGISPDVDIVTNAISAEHFPRPLIVEDSGVVTDFLWADPSPDDPGFVESDRGASWTFGTRVSADFLRRNGFDLLIRAHQVVKNGYDFPFEPDHSVVTVFSCPNYCGDCENNGATIVIEEDMKCQFKVINWNEDGEEFEKRCEQEAQQRQLRRIMRSPTPIAIPMPKEEAVDEEEDNEEESWTSAPESEEEDYSG
jgi:diadenosine tetraphosphatase ApaH/serine/threonine PP2A family protein phosphatase